MSPAILRRYRAERLLQRDFQGLRGQVLGTVSSRLRASGLSLDSSDLEACYAQAWQGLYAATLGGEEIDNACAWLVLVTYRRAIEELRTRRDRDAQTDGEPAHNPSLEGAIDDRERLRELMEGMRAQLDVREREAAALCYLQGYSRSQAAARMGISETRMRKVMEGSGGGEKGVSGKVGAIVETIRQGAFCEEQGSLMRALAFGVLDPDGERHRLAMLHHRRCPACRRYVATLRGAAAVLPPVLTLPGHSAVGLTGLAGLGHHGAAGLSGSGPGAGSGASAGVLGASAVAGGGGAAGGSWLLGGAGLGAKLAVGCLLALGVGAGCVALQEPGSTHHGRAEHAQRPGPARSLTTASSASLLPPSASTAPAGDRAQVKTTVAHSAAVRAAQEFGPEQASHPAPANTVTATAAKRGESSGEFGARESAQAHAAADSAAAAQREFSPG